MQNKGLTSFLKYLDFVRVESIQFLQGEGDPAVFRVPFLTDTQHCVI